MKVYICTIVPDYIGYFVEHIYFNEKDAIKWKEEFLKKDPYNKYSYPEYEEFEIEEKYSDD